MNAFPQVTSYNQRGPSSSGTDLKVYDTPQSQMVGHDVVFRCRDEGPSRLPVRWSRKDGKPFPPKTTDVEGRLTMYEISPGEAGTYVCTVIGSNVAKEGQLSVTPKPLEPYGDGNGGRGVNGRDGFSALPLRRLPATEICGPNQIKCRNGDCISRDSVCNGVAECSDKSDETSCGEFLSIYHLNTSSNY